MCMHVPSFLDFLPTYITRERWGEPPVRCSRLSAVLCVIHGIRGAYVSLSLPAHPTPTPSLAAVPLFSTSVTISALQKSPTYWGCKSKLPAFEDVFSKWCTSKSKKWKYKRYVSVSPSFILLIINIFNPPDTFTCLWLSHVNLNHSHLLYGKALQNFKPILHQFSSVQSLSRVWLLATPWIATCQASLSITNSKSPPKPMSIESVMPSNHLFLCCPLLLLPSIFPSIRVFSNESALCIRWPKYWRFSFNISPSNEHPRLISFRMDWLDLLAVQGTLKSFL